MRAARSVGAVKLGLFVPPFGPLADPRVLADLAERAEDGGWDGVFLWDHVLYRDPATHVLDPWTALAAMAVRTSRVRLGALVTPLARRRVQVLARQVAALDLLSGGRMVVGAGLGLDSSGGELSRFGEELDDRARAAMLDERLEVLAALLSGEEVRSPLADGVRFLPTPVQPRVPVWVGARWPHRAPLRRAARWDGVFPIDLDDPAVLPELLAVVAEHRTATSPFDVVVQGTAGEPADRLAQWEEAGATWWVTRTDPFSLDLETVRATAARAPGR